MKLDPAENNMENKPRELPPTTRSAFGPLKEMRNLQANGSASVAELKEFLSSLHGKNPQEVIGIISSSMLLQSLGIAVVATFCLLFVGTLGPYLIYGPPKPKATATKSTTNAVEKTANDSKAVSTAATDGQKSKTSDADQAIKKLGLDEVKDADPGKNPLDKGPDIDNLLDSIDP
jgi:hypothetical protein